MSWIQIAKTYAQSVNNNNVTTSAIDTTGATLLVVMLAGHTDTSFGTFSDSKGNTWSIASSTTAGSAGRGVLYYCVPSSVGSGHTFTFTLGSPCAPALAVLAYSGGDATPFDQQSGFGSSNNTISSGSITPSEDGELLICGLESGSEVGTIDSGFTVEESAVATADARGIAISTLIQTSASAVNATTNFSTIDQHIALIASFKLAPDTDPPTITDIATNGTGDAINCTLSESGCIPTSGTGGFSLSGTSATVSSWSISGTILTLSLSGLIVDSDTITLSYDRATTTDDISDAASNFLANFSGSSVTNGVLNAPVLSITSITGSSISLSWTATGSIDTFTLQRDTTSDFTSPIETEIDPEDTESANITGLTVGIRYYFRIRSNNEFGSSGWSNVAFDVSANPSLNSFSFVFIF